MTTDTQYKLGRGLAEEELDPSEESALIVDEIKARIDSGGGWDDETQRGYDEGWAAA